MQVSFFINRSPKNALHKSLGNGSGYDFVFKSSASLNKPIITLQTNDDLTIYNYCYIPNWSRYYYINPNNVTVQAGNRYEIELECDALMTFASQIAGNRAIIDRTESVGGSNYINSEAFVATCKHKTDILNFPAGLNTNGTFILITAGG